LATKHENKTWACRIFCNLPEIPSVWVAVHESMGTASVGNAVGTTKCWCKEKQHTP